MAYTPYEWTVNSYLNPTRMNAIEQGIAEASQAAESASGEFHTIEELIGTQSIAGIGDGTLTGATWKINNDLSDLKNTVTTLNSNLNNIKTTNILMNTLLRSDQSANLSDSVKNYETIIVECAISESTERMTIVLPSLMIKTGTSAYDNSVIAYANNQEYLNTVSVSFPTETSIKFLVEYHKTWKAPVITAVYGIGKIS